MKCTTVLSVVIASHLAVSEVTSTPTNTKIGYKNDEPKRSSLTQPWQGKRNVLMGTKDDSLTANANTKSVKTIAAARRGFRSAVRFNDTHNTSSNTSCPTWTYPIEDCCCECGDTLNGAIKCNVSTHRLDIYRSYCMTYDNSTGNTVAGNTGPCVHKSAYMIESSELYHPLPHAPSLCRCPHISVFS